MIYYLTYNDSPSGVYRSQVAGVCAYLSQISDQPVKLVAIVSIRGFFKTRKKIKLMYANAKVLPMYPKHRNWRKNKFHIKRAIKNRSSATVIARGVFANNLAQSVGGYKKLIFDGRGAYSAEFQEYLGDSHSGENVKDLERNSILKSDFRIAVSHALVDHWRSEYDYKLDEHVVIPCTLNEPSFDFSKEDLVSARTKLGIREDEVVFVYSGSIAGWQSKGMMDNFALKVLSQTEDSRMIFLSQFNVEEFESHKKYGNRVMQMWVSPNEVKNILLCADYGVMIREKTITNKVASPTKFAEYLLAGLKVITTAELGDYSELVSNEDLGLLYDDEIHALELKITSFEEKKRLSTFAINNFTKDSYKLEYQKIIA